MWQKLEVWQLCSSRIKNMSKCFEVYGYVVSFWSNENDPIEPVHVHIGKQKIQKA